MKRWTNKEVEYLLEQAKVADINAAALAKRMGRSYAGLTAKMRELGLVIKHTPRTWTAERDERLTEMHEAGESTREICRALGITVGAYQARVFALGIGRPVRQEAAPKGPCCPVCFIGLEYVAGCPREGCQHYTPPAGPVERTLAGVGSAMLV